MLFILVGWYIWIIKDKPWFLAWRWIVKILINKFRLLNESALHAYIKICQSEEGGLFDKPGKSVDAYHTCYALSGYSVTGGDLKKIDPIYNIC